jgi:hypothetical protein
MSEIKRTNETEKYSTTASWLNDFFSKVAKDKPPAPPIVTAKTEKFATIEEKMADIKARVGFGSISGITKESSSDLIVESSKKCNCGKSCSCKKNYDKKIHKLKGVLKYISDMIESEPHLLEPEIVARCLDNKDLGFDSLRIKPKKLSKFIEKRKKPAEDIQVMYIRPDIDSTSNIQGDIADYYRHGMPNLF